VDVTFTKMSNRRYGVHVRRDRAPDLWLRGPGYDDDLPHDLLHFVLEAELGLDEAVFGDVAAGGNARIFEPVDPTLVAKMWRQKRMHRYVLPEGRRSEVLAGVLETAWHARRDGRPLPESDHLAAADFERLLPKLDELADRWQELAPGEGLTLEWPRPEGRRKHPARDRRRPAARRH
jgi:hypothetical protein